jgi:hypothetical protein
VPLRVRGLPRNHQRAEIAAAYLGGSLTTWNQNRSTDCIAFQY